VSAIPARWYMVNNCGAATLCCDEADANHVAEESDRLFPRDAPHVAVQLAPVAREIDAQSDLPIPAGVGSKSVGAQGVPEGWRLVPVEPTEAMVDAGNDGAAPYMVNARDLWAQMIQAAPTPPTNTKESQ
jgi:hypothetical protein